MKDHEKFRNVKNKYENHFSEKPEINIKMPKKKKLKKKDFKLKKKKIK